MKRATLRQLVAVGLILVGLVVLLAMPTFAQGIPKSFFDWVVTKKLTVTTGGADFQSSVTMDDVTLSGDLSINDLEVTGTSDLQGNVSSSSGVLTVTDNILLDGQADAAQLTVQGWTTQTTGLLVLEQSDGTDKMTVSNEGQVVIVAEADSDANNYDNWFTVEGSATGTTTKDRNFPIKIDMTRPAGQEIANGDHNEAGLLIRVDTEAVTTTVGTVLRAIDAEAKADNPSGTVTNLYGANITSKSDTGAGSVDSMIALQTNAQNNAAVVTNLMSADFRIMRQAATVPTNEYVIQVRSSSTTGSGADAAIYVASDYGGSPTTDSFGYGLDFSGAAINTADLRLSNGETIANTTDGLITLGGGLQHSPASITDTQTITPTMYGFYTINATAEATVTLAACANVGQVVYLYADDAQTINLPATNILTTDGNALAVDQYDLVGLMCAATEWALMFEINLQ